MWYAESTYRNNKPAAAAAQPGERRADMLGAVNGNGNDASAHTIIRNPGESTHKQAGRKSSPAECETCKNRKYQDGSDENVSFKSPAHISPSAAGARVRGHEQEHVANAYKDAAQNNGKVISCNVSIHTAVCPECGRTYVSGGTTLKSSDAAGKYRGMNLDAAF